LHPKVEESFDLKRAVFVFELYFDRIFELRQSRLMFQPLPKFPSVARDMALVVDDAMFVASPLELVSGMKEPLLEKMDVFDVYQSPQLGEGKKSVAYRLVYRAPDRSLTDEEVNLVHAGLVDTVLKELNATLR
jgi:phenylalanyl-tRNA synthetase beta chain